LNARAGVPLVTQHGKHVCRVLLRGWRSREAEIHDIDRTPERGIEACVRVGCCVAHKSMANKRVTWQLVVTCADQYLLTDVC
jgi:hypothetical protein